RSPASSPGLQREASWGWSPAVAEHPGCVPANASARSAASGDSPITTTWPTPAVRARAITSPASAAKAASARWQWVSTSTAAAASGHRLRPAGRRRRLAPRAGRLPHAARLGTRPAALDPQQDRPADEDGREGADEHPPEHHQGERAHHVAPEGGQREQAPQRRRPGEHGPREGLVYGAVEQRLEVGALQLA